MIRNVTLPVWLDNLIFVNLNAMYCKSNSDMTVIDWESDQILAYLGTYFPRSYAESYCLFKQIFETNNIFSGCCSISVFDFGCGIGGEIIGMATAFDECFPEIKEIKVKAIDGNRYALNRFDDIKDEFNKRNKVQIMCEPSAIKIDDFYDLSILDTILDSSYDIVISFKAVCEFVTKQQFEEKNAYEHLVKFMLPKLSDTGIMLLADIATRSNVANEWLPELMDKGLRKAEAFVLARNPGFNESFTVNHSHKIGDMSKIAWRLISKTDR